MRKMSKKDLIDDIAQAEGVSKADAERALNGVVNALSQALIKGDKVTITDFGTFSVADRAARTVPSPQTGQPINVPASKQPKFKVGKGLKDAVNGRR